MIDHIYQDLSHSGRSIRLAVVTLFILLIFSPGTSFAERSLLDMMSRTVIVPDKVSRLVTIGPVPVLNSFVFVMGEAGSIVNSPPPNLRGARWWLSTLIAPHTLDHPAVQGADGVSIERLVNIAPDVVLTMDKRTVDSLERTRIPTIYLAWRKPEDVKRVVRLLGDLFGKPDAAKAYSDYFDGLLGRVEARLAPLPLDQRPRVLYAQLSRMSQPHQIAEWWIAKAGGRSVTDNDRIAESFNFSIEHVLAWDPEVLIVGRPEDVEAAYADQRLADVSAIRNRRVHAVPMGAHLWGNRTVEQPLTVLWAAGIIHPQLFADIDLGKEVGNFYRTFFKIDLDERQIDSILKGRVWRP